MVTFAPLIVLIAFCQASEDINSESQYVAEAWCHTSDKNLPSGDIEAQLSDIDPHMQGENRFPCMIIDAQNRHKANGLFEIATFNTLTNGINFETSNAFVEDLIDSMIVCSFSEIISSESMHGSNNVESSSVTYTCDGTEIDGLKIVFTGVPDISMDEKLTKSNMDKRSSTGESIDRHRHCVKHSKKPEKIDTTHRKYEGRECAFGKNQTGRFMYNEDKIFGCLLCCADHHWDRRTNECKRCPPGQIRPKPSPFETCLPKYQTSTTSHRKRYDPTQIQPVQPKPTTTIESNYDRSTGGKIPIANKDSAETSSPPTCVPHSLKVLNFDSNSALLNWRPYCCMCEDMTHVQVKVVFQQKGRIKGRFLKNVSESTSTYKLENLLPNKHYCVEIRAVDSANADSVEYGPWSNAITFHTRKKLKPPSNVKLALENGIVKLNWTVHGSEKDFSVEVTYELHEVLSGGIRFNQSGRGHLQFLLPLRGNYALSVAYIDDHDQIGPKAPIRRLAYEPECTARTTELETAGVNYALIAVIVILVIIVILLVIFISWKFYSKDSVLCGQRNGYSPSTRTST